MSALKLQKSISCIRYSCLTSLIVFPMLTLGYPSTHFKSLQPSMLTLVVFSHCMKCFERQSHTKIFCCILIVTVELFLLKLSRVFMASLESLQCNIIIGTTFKHTTKVENKVFLSLFSTFLRLNFSIKESLRTTFLKINQLCVYLRNIFSSVLKGNIVEVIISKILLSYIFQNYLVIIFLSKLMYLSEGRQSILKSKSLSLLSVRKRSCNCGS